MRTKLCPVCKEYKDVRQFAWKFRILGVRSATCKACHNIAYGQPWYDTHREQVIDDKAEQRRRYKEQNREWIMDYLSTHPCVDCGETDPLVLEFDHVRGRKTMEVSRMVANGHSPSKVQFEIAKCEVRCSNCHRRKTAQGKGWYKDRR